MVHRSVSYSIINADVISGSARIPCGSIRVENGIITRIAPRENATRGDGEATGSLPVFDAGGMIAGPGLIDMHIHGAGGVDTSSTDMESALTRMASFLEERGITSFQPATMMDSGILRRIAGALDANPLLARKIPGVYVEGPFIAAEKKGGLPAESIRDFSPEYLAEILSVRNGERPLVRTMTLAPEKPGFAEAARTLADNGVLAAWGHSSAYLSDVEGLNPIHMTHLFNAMNGIDHKKPGLATLPFTLAHGDVTFEIIADGVHIHQAVLELVFSTPAASRACLISDSTCFGGMPAGRTRYLGHELVNDGRSCRNEDNGVLIGSSMLIARTARELFMNGLIDETGFFRIASGNPARVTGMTDRGILAEGKRADIVLCGPDMEIREVFACGL